MRVPRQPGRTSNSPRQAGCVSERSRCPLQVVRRAGLVQIGRAEGYATRQRTRDRETDRTSRHVDYAGGRYGTRKDVQDDIADLADLSAEVESRPAPASAW